MKLKSNDNISSISIDGQEYEVKDGLADFKESHVAVALAHGFEHFVEEEFVPTELAKLVHTGEQLEKPATKKKK